MLPEELLDEREVNRVGSGKGKSVSNEVLHGWGAHMASLAGANVDTKIDIEDEMQQPSEETREQRHKGTGTGHVMQDVGKGEEFLTSLPFQPVIMTFRDVCYFVDMSVVSSTILSD